MIRSPHENTIICNTCSYPAVRRTIEHISARSANTLYSYDTHVNCMMHDEHVDKLSQMNEFLQKCEDLCYAFKQKSAEDLKLTYGKILSVDFIPTMHDACSEFKYARCEAIIGAFGLIRTVEIDYYLDVSECVPNKLLNVIKRLSEPVVQQMREDFRAGNF